MGLSFLKIELYLALSRGPLSMKLDGYLKRNKNKNWNVILEY